MSDFYDVPAVSNSFNADEAVAVRAKEAGSAATKMIEDWKTAFEKFWMTPRTHGDRALSKADTQAMLLANPTLLGNILTDSAAFRDFLQAAHPDKIGDDKLIPTRFMSTPYDIDGTLTLTGDLKKEWSENWDQPDE